mmetsp:Transcript_35458/g.63911  ORF Transcript_35458/g.63911 Transcript_35458/m.63911 type:complete len:205 (+) Transcript_35458:774-1388(+)
MMIPHIFGKSSHLMKPVRMTCSGGMTCFLSGPLVDTFFGGMTSGFSSRTSVNTTSGVMMSSVTTSGVSMSSVLPRPLIKSVVSSDFVPRSSTCCTSSSGTPSSFSSRPSVESVALLDTSSGGTPSFFSFRPSPSGFSSRPSTTVTSSGGSGMPSAFSSKPSVGSAVFVDISSGEMPSIFSSRPSVDSMALLETSSGGTPSSFSS